MIIFVDANQIAGDHRLRLRVWEQLSRADGVRVVTSRIAIAEAASRFGPMRERLATSILRDVRHFSEDAKKLVQEAARITRAEIPVYEQWILARWRSLGFEIVEPPEITHGEVVERAIGRVPPFDLNGNGYRDTLHWYSFLDLAEENPNDDLLFATSDKGFLTSDGALLPQLLQEVSALLEERGTAAAVEMGSLVPPGRYRDTAVEVPEHFENELSESVELLLETNGAIGDVPPANLGIRDADYITLSEPTSFRLEAATARELTANKCLEIKFEVTADVMIRKFSLEQTDSSAAILSDTTERRLLFTGTAVSDESHELVDDIEELEVELFNSPSNFEMALKTLRTLQLSESGEPDEETDAWRSFFAEARDRPKPRPTRLIEPADDK